VEGFARGDFLWAVDVKEFDGAALEPKYTLPPFDDPEPEANFEGWKLYKGACHCRAVRMALRTKGQLWEEEELIGECNCSICVRVSYAFLSAFLHPNSLSPSLTLKIPLERHNRNVPPLRPNRDRPLASRSQTGKLCLCIKDLRA